MSDAFSNDEDGASLAPESGGDELSSAEIQSLREQLAAAEKARDDMKDLAQRTLADFQNYKARALKDAQSARRFTLKDALSAVLPAFDNLERALGAADHGGDGDGLREGVTLTLRNFEDGLSRLGVLRVVTAGAAFDPASMEALARVESPEHAEGAVIAEWESGWRMPELMIRPARVSVAVAPKRAPKASAERNDATDDRRADDSNE